MGWGDVPSWVAIALSVIAGGHSWWTGKKAREATAGTASVEESLERIADNLARDRELRPGFEIRASAGDVPPAPVRAPEFLVEFVSGHAYRLRNVGTGGATGVTVTLPDFPEGLTRGLPRDSELPPMASTGNFVIQGAWGTPAPGEVQVSCDQLEAPVFVPLPARS